MTHRQVETYQVQADQDTHGYSGFLKVSVNKTPGNVAQDFFGVCSKYDSTRGTTNDMNGMFSCDGYAVSVFLSLQRDYLTQ